MEKLKGSGGRGGAYEQPLEGGRRGRGRALDPDEAWDARVGAEADAGGYAFEEQELGLREEAEYGGGGYGNEGQVLPAYGEERGRSLNRGAGAEGYIGGGQRGLDERYEEEMGGREDPFGDEAERSELRGVSPRPHVEAKGDGKVGSGGGMSDDSPTERRSMFHENV